MSALQSPGGPKKKDENALQSSGGPETKDENTFQSPKGPEKRDENAPYGPAMRYSIYGGLAPVTSHALPRGHLLVHGVCTVVKFDAPIFSVIVPFPDDLG